MRNALQSTVPIFKKLFSLGVEYIFNQLFMPKYLLIKILKKLNNFNVMRRSSISSNIKPFLHRKSFKF